MPRKGPAPRRETVPDPISTRPSRTAYATPGRTSTAPRTGSLAGASASGVSSAVHSACTR